jgi:hypothetical protein
MGVFYFHGSFRMFRRGPPRINNRPPAPGNNRNWSDLGFNLANNPFVQTLGLGFLTYNFFPGASGAIDTIMGLLPVMVLGGGGLYLINTLKK